MGLRTGESILSPERLQCPVGSMGKKEKIASVLQLVGGNKKNVENIVNEIDMFLDSLNAEIEDWKFSMEEYKDGTRIFARFQILIKK
jgi:hypothetical protein